MTEIKTDRKVNVLSGWNNDEDDFITRAPTLSKNVMKQ